MLFFLFLFIYLFFAEAAASNSDTCIIDYHINSKNHEALFIFSKVDNDLQAVESMHHPTFG